MRRIKKIVAVSIIAALCLQSMPIIKTSATGGNSTSVGNTTQQSTAIREKTYFYDESATEFIRPVESIVDVSNDVKIYNTNVDELVWEVDVKTTESKTIQALLSVFDNSNAHHYMSLYLKGNNIGLEAKNSENSKFNRMIQAPNINDGNWHTIKMVLTSEKLTFYMDGGELGYWTNWNNDFITLKNMTWTPTSFTIGGMKRYGITEQEYNWLFSGSMKNAKVSVANKDGTTRNALYIDGDEGQQFTRPVESIVDVSDDVKMYNTNVNELVWEVDVKTTQSKAIQALLSVFDSINAHHYMSLYLKGNIIGFEAKNSETNKFNKIVEAPNINDGNWHTIKMVLTPEKLTFYMDGSELGYRTNWNNDFITLKNITWTPTSFTIGGMKRYGITEQANNWLFSGSMKNAKASVAYKDGTTQSGLYIDGHRGQQFNKSVESIVDLSDDVNMYSGSIHELVWEVDVKTTESKTIQALLSVFDNVNAHHYMSLYLKGNNIGLEAKNSENKKFDKMIQAPGINDGNWHTIKMVLTPEKLTFYMDGSELGYWTNWNNDLISLQNLTWTPTSFTIGGMKRYGITNQEANWLYNGSMRNLTVSLQVEEGTIPPTSDHLIYEKSAGSNLVGRDITSETLGVFKPLTTGTVTVRYKANNPNQGLSALLSLSNVNQANSYAVVYVDPSSNKVGVEVRDGTNSTNTTNYNQTSTTNVSIRDDYWHTVTAVFGANNFKIYVDGKEATSNNKSGFFSKVSSATTVKIGALDRSNGLNQWKLNGLIDKVEVYNQAVDVSEFIHTHDATTYTPQYGQPGEGSVKTDPMKLFSSGYDNSASYRIPSILTTTSGTIIAAIDKRQSGSHDYGNIDTAIRRSTDGGQTWSNPQTLIDLPKGSGNYAFTIDASMVQDQSTGTIFLFVDMFPESTGLMAGDTINVASSGYKTINGKKYCILRSKSGNQEYTIREGGVVYDSNGIATNYTVPDLTDGTLYQNNAKVGNIMLKNSALQLLKTSYLWMLTSSDDGVTWSDPVDITKDVKEDWQVFFGTGPGVGIQMDDGRLVVPVYYTNKNIGGSQSSAVIYSDDHGKTWHLGESPNDGRVVNGTTIYSQTMNYYSEMLTESQVVEVKGVNNESILKLFCRSPKGNGGVRIATSRDGGETWENELQIDTQLRDPYCQMSIVKYPYEVKGYEGKQMFIFSNPDAGSRTNGTVRLGYYEPTTDQFVWLTKRVVEKGAFSYSTLTVIDENKIGLFYEAQIPNMMFTSFNLEWLTSDLGALPMEAPQVKNISKSGYIVTVTFSQAVFAVGDVKVRARINNQEVLIPYTSGSGTNELIFTLDNGGLYSNNSIQFIGIVTQNGGYFGNRENSQIQNK